MLRPVSRVIFFVTSISRSPRRSNDSDESRASNTMSGSGAGASGTAAGNTDTILPATSMSSRYSVHRNRSRSSTRARVKLHVTGVWSTLRTLRLTPLARAIFRSSSPMESRPDVTSTSCPKRELRSTRADSLSSRPSVQRVSECSSAAAAPDGGVGISAAATDDTVQSSVRNRYAFRMNPSSVNDSLLILSAVKHRNQFVDRGLASSEKVGHSIA